MSQSSGLEVVEETEERRNTIVQRKVIRTNYFSARSKLYKMPSQANTLGIGENTGTVICWVIEHAILDLYQLQSSNMEGYNRRYTFTFSL
jgi:hypothetical protein